MNESAASLRETLAGYGVILPDRTGPVTLMLDCEPGRIARFICLRDDFARVIGGLRLCAKALGAEEAVICVPREKREQIRPLRRLLPRKGDIRIVMLRPEDGEPEESCLRRTLGSATVLDPGLCRDAWLAFYEQKPRTSRPFTVLVLENAVAYFELPFGATTRDALARIDIEAVSSWPGRIAAGSLLTGTEVLDRDAPLSDDVDALFLLREADFAPRRGARCIRCGSCRKVCPEDLPVYALALGWGGDFTCCIDCGACSYHCPERLDLNALLRAAKEAAL